MLNQVEDLLRELGVQMVDWRRQGLTEGRWEGTQLKAIADQRAHDFLVEGLTRIDSTIPIVSEEDLASLVEPRPSDYWLIDPIDGTASFCNGFDGFVTQVARLREAQPILGVVHAPALELTYTAEADGPATCNGTVLHVSDSAAGAPILIDNYPEPRGIAKTLLEGLPCRGYVESGSLGLKICRVADGTAGLFVKDVVVKDWDLAPGHLVLKQAGGVLWTADGETVPYTGQFARCGIVAATGQRLGHRVVDFLTSR
jgi:3'(2'), 5'-bisphosphate nucleotidase/myo-inositol-1(or 4)-monophosphatase